MRIFITASLLLVLQLLSYNGNSQSWQWVRGNKLAGMDGWPVATDKFGNVFAAGISWGASAAQFGTVSVPFSHYTPAGYQSILTKYDAVGNVQWAKGTTNGDTWVIGVCTDGYGNAYLFGTFQSPAMKIGNIILVNTLTPATSRQCFLAKFDPSGNVLWAKNFGNAQLGGAGLGGISSVLGVGGVMADAAGNVFVTANFQNATINIGAITLTNTDPTGTSDDIFLAKFNTNGVVLWAKNYGGDGTDDAYGITIVPSGDIYLAGQFSSPTIAFGSTTIANTSTTQIGFIARLDGAGSPVWACGSGGSGGEYAIGLASDATGNIYLTGGVKDNIISFSGTTIYNYYAPQAALYLVKFDPTNNVVWSKVMGSPSRNRGTWGYSVATSVCGSVWVSGAMQIDTPARIPSSVEIDGNVLTAPAGSTDPVFIAGFTYSGVYDGGATLSSGADDQVCIACDASGCVYICSDYESQVNLEVGSYSLPSDSIAGELLYLAKYSPLKTVNPIIHDTTFCAGTTVTMVAPNGFGNYLWSDGYTGNEHPGNLPGNYWVFGEGKCASSIIDSFRLVTCDCGHLFVPNSFSPNGDGNNDLFYPRGDEGIKIVSSFRIYNRWGDLIFEKTNIQINDVGNSWDGTYNNQIPLPEVFVWVVDAVCENGTKITKKGSVTVVR